MIELNKINQHYFDMGAIRESENTIREKHEAYIKELNRVSSALSKKCATCTKPIIITKDGIKNKCLDCNVKKSFDLHMELYAQMLELKKN